MLLRQRVGLATNRLTAFRLVPVQLYVLSVPTDLIRPLGYVPSSPDSPTYLRSDRRFESPGPVSPPSIPTIQLRHLAALARKRRHGPTHYRMAASKPTSRWSRALCCSPWSPTELGYYIPGPEGGTRTLMPLRAAVFETAASADSATTGQLFSTVGYQLA